MAPHGKSRSSELIRSISHVFFSEELGPSKKYQLIKPRGCPIHSSVKLWPCAVDFQIVYIVNHQSFPPRSPNSDSSDLASLFSQVYLLQFASGQNIQDELVFPGNGPKEKNGRLALSF